MFKSFEVVNRRAEIKSKCAWKSWVIIFIKWGQRRFRVVVEDGCGGDFQCHWNRNVGATVKGLRLLLTSYLQNGAEAETMLVESGLGGEYWKSKWEKKCLRGTILETEQKRRLGGGVGAWVRLGGENPNVRANKVRMPCLSACDRMQGNRKARKKKFTRQHCHKLCTKLLALSLLVAAA